MALKTKTFRTSDAVVEALAEKSTELQVSESEVINKALKCFLGVFDDPDCTTYSKYEDLYQIVQDMRVKLSNQGLL